MPRKPGNPMPGSKKLREWVKSHKNSRYVPESLLDAYGMKVDVDSAFGERRLPGF